MIFYFQVVIGFFYENFALIFVVFLNFVTLIILTFLFAKLLTVDALLSYCLF